ncbi:uncharacterized protein BJ212DRAFT_1525096, partial [Suillus subaureus]
LRRTNVPAFPRSPASKLQPVDTFNPIPSSLDDMDSIVIPVNKATIYLDKSLRVLGLHTEARTSFITCVHMRYLRLSNHKHVTKTIGYLLFLNTNLLPSDFSSSGIRTRRFFMHFSAA